MKIKQLLLNNEKWDTLSSCSSFNDNDCQLVLVFGSSDCITRPDLSHHLSTVFPKANIVYSSTAGEILKDGVYESMAVTAIQFEKTEIKCYRTSFTEHKNSYEIGKHLMQQMPAENLTAVFVVADGTNINGSELVAGLNASNENNISITGGLAGDGTKFEKTFVGLNEVPSEGMVVAAGFYGTELEVSHGSCGGWDEFGPERTITRSDKNVLYEIDGKNALDFYKEYLGPYKEELPGSALFFPLSLRVDVSSDVVVRTILAINEIEKTMTFAGDLPENSKVRLMKGNFDKLIDASSEAARNSMHKFSDKKPQLAILISCVGRKIILHDRTDEEVQAAIDVYGENTSITGFYSYGEMCPFKTSSKCELHNQTMTITTFSEN